MTRQQLDFILRGGVRARPGMAQWEECTCDTRRSALIGGGVAHATRASAAWVCITQIVSRNGRSRATME